MNLAQSLSAFRYTIWPFGLAVGLLQILLMWLTMRFSDNPLGEVRNLDLLLFVAILALMLIRFNFRAPQAPLYWEVFLAAFVCFGIGLLLYLVATFAWLYADPQPLAVYVAERREFILDHKEAYLEQTRTQKHFNALLQNLSQTTVGDYVAGQLLSRVLWAFSSAPSWQSPSA
jgi:hypothetical protein